MRLTTLGITLGLVACAAVGQAQTTRYPQMAPIEQYFISD